MKKTYPLILVVLISLLLFSCEKDEGDFHQVSAYESSLAAQINAHRTSVGKPTLVLQFIIGIEARAQCALWANGTISDPTQGIEGRWNTINGKIGGTTRGLIYEEVGNLQPDEVVDLLLQDPGWKAIIEDEFTQIGPGAVVDTDGNTRIILMFLNIPDK